MAADRSAAKVGRTRRWNALRSEIAFRGFGWWRRAAAGEAVSAEHPAATCHVFVVSRFVLPADKPDDACIECGEPLAVHEKRTSSLIPRDKVFVIDEKALNV